MCSSFPRSGKKIVGELLLCLWVTRLCVAWKNHVSVCLLLLFMLSMIWRGSCLVLTLLVSVVKLTAYLSDDTVVYLLTVLLVLLTVLGAVFTCYTVWLVLYG